MEAYLKTSQRVKVLKGMLSKRARALMVIMPKRVWFPEMGKRAMGISKRSTKKPMEMLQKIILFSPFLFLKSFKKFFSQKKMPKITPIKICKSLSEKTVPFPWQECRLYRQ